MKKLEGHGIRTGAALDNGFIAVDADREWLIRGEAGVSVNAVFEARIKKSESGFSGHNDEYNLKVWAAAVCQLNFLACLNPFSIICFRSTDFKFSSF